MTRGTLKSQYFRDKIEIFIRLFDEHCSPFSLTWDVTSYWQADCTTDFLGDNPPPHPPESEEKRGEMCRPVIMVAQFLDLKNLSWQRRPFALSNDGRNVWANVLFPSGTMHTKVTHANFFLPYLQDCGLLRSRSFSTGVEEGGFCRGGLHSPQGGAIYSHKKGWFLASF